MPIYDLMARPFVTFVERYYPDAFVFAIVLTAATFAMVLGATDTGPAEALAIWGRGLPGLMAFIAQLSITLISAHALAHTDAVHGAIVRLARLPRRRAQAYVLVVLVAGLGSLIAWSLGLVVGALIAREVARVSSERGLGTHFPLLVASAYGGFVVWHMGYSGSAPLFVATPGHALEAQMGIVPITETVFTWWNGLTIVCTLAVVAWVAVLLHPGGQPMAVDPDAASPAAEAAAAPSPGERIERARVLSLLAGALLLAFLIQWFMREGLVLTLDIVNWSFVAAGLLLARSPLHYVQLLRRGAGPVGPIIIQYPFYAGIMALMGGTGLVGVLSAAFTEVASPETLPFWAFLAGGVVNLFVPSGGGQWAVQGPVFIDAARQLGVDNALIVMGIAYGDQWSNLIQPFWTLPLLAIAGLHMRQIMGFAFVMFLASGVVLGSALLLVAR